MTSAALVHDAAALEKFRGVQRLAFQCAEEIGSKLRPGVTEREAADDMRRWLLAHGVDDWFHLPFAWFGDRTTFAGVRVPRQFYPSNKRLEMGMPFILDVGPVVSGFAVDIGYAGCLGENRLHAKLMSDLSQYRDLILAGVRARKTLRAIYVEVDVLLERHGYRNRHRKYPFGVLAHRVDVVGGRGRERTVAGFGVRSLRTLAQSFFVAARRGQSPLWNDGRLSDHAPTPGLWAVEPHIGFGDVGVKFEELLVITEDDAYWLDDDLPHVRAWRSAA